MISNNVQKCPREELIIKLKNLFQKKVPIMQLSDFDISRIIYNNPKFIKDDFLHARKIRENSRPDLLVFMKILYYVQNLRTNDILRHIKGGCINSPTLDTIKKDIKKLIINFIFENPYAVKYVKQDNRVIHKMDIRFWKPEFELFFDLWYASSLNSNKPITIKSFQKKIGNPAFSTPTKIGKCITKYLFKLFEKMPLLFSKISENDFKQVRLSIIKYIKIRRISDIYRDYSIYWNDEFTKKVQVTILLLRDLGLDILTLEKIPSISFRNNLNHNDPIKFHRHHIFPNNKETLDPNKLVLTIHKSHKKLEGCTDLLLRLINERIKWSNNLPYYYKNLEQKPCLWQEFIKRRDDLRYKGIYSFFKMYYPDVINRFYKNVPKDQFELTIRQLINEWVNDGNPCPLFPKYLQSRLCFRYVN